MPEYTDHVNKEVVKINIDNKGFKFPPSGAKILRKRRPPIAKEVKTD